MVVTRLFGYNIFNIRGHVSPVSDIYCTVLAISMNGSSHVWTLRPYTKKLPSRPTTCSTPEVRISSTADTVFTIELSISDVNYTFTATMAVDIKSMPLNLDTANSIKTLHYKLTKSCVPIILSF